MPTKQKRAEILFLPDEHARLKKQATNKKMSLSNYIRDKLGLPKLKAGAPVGKRAAKKISSKK